LASHPQLCARERIFTVDHPAVGSLSCIGSPARFCHDPQARPVSPTPLFGQHNAEILAELGYPDTDQAQLALDNVIGDSPFGLSIPAAPAASTGMAGI
jgi:crotonobetainyl-CoA:carnitine CoA-transferase CaiB-like acyl-CoA transferase